MTEQRNTTRYTHGHHESVLRSHRWRTAENSAAYLLPELRPGLSLLDIGCGPGTITVDLARIVAPGRVWGIDSSPEVLAGAADAAAASGLGNVVVSVGDVRRLDFDDASFDAVHAHQVLQHLTDPVGALREMRRVCHADGVVAARDADYSSMSWYPKLPALEEWMSLYHQVARSNGAEPDAAPLLRHWAHEAGLQDVTSSASVWCYSTESERTWWGESWADRVVASAFGEQAVQLGLTDMAGLERIAVGWREWAADDDAWFAVLNGEILGRP